MKGNKGFTLVEIIVAMLVMAVTFAGVFVAFMSINKVNVVSRVSQSQASISNSLLEVFYDLPYDKINYNDIKEDIASKLASNYTWEEDDNAFSYSKSDDGATQNIKLNSIRGSASEYSADIVLTSFSVDKEGFEGFSNFDIFKQDGTRTINIYKPETIDTKYEDLVGDEFLKRGEIYAKANDSVIPDRDDFLDHIDCNLNISTVKSGKKSILNANMVFKLNNASTYIGDSLEDTITYPLYENVEIYDFSNLLIFTTNYTSINKIHVNIQNGNSSDMNTACKYNLFLVASAGSYSDDNNPEKYSVESYFEAEKIRNPWGNDALDFKFTQLNPDTNLCKLYTNIKSISVSNNPHFQIYGEKELQNRMYNVDIIVKEKLTGTFEHINETVLVLENGK